ncbi:MAG: HNH endonuclease [Actinobacteria bacterium]|nr:HNH endonuclease [Actinomycetota bacterium]
MKFRFPKLHISWLDKRREKREFLKNKIRKRAEVVRKYIQRLANNWPEEYKELCLEELEDVEKTENELINLIDALDNKTIDNLFILSREDTPTHIRDQAIRFIRKHPDKRVQGIARIASWVSIPGFEPPLRKHIKRVEQRRKGASSWKKKKREILKKKRKCEVCGSRENLEVHHLRGLSHESPEDLAVLCRKCHKELHALAETLKWQPYKLRREFRELLKSLEAKGVVEDLEKQAGNKEEHCYLLAYYLLKEKARTS